MKDFLIKIQLEEIKYDIKFDTWLRDKILSKESNVSCVYSDDRAEDWLVRQIETAIDNIRGEINWCVADHSTALSDEIQKNPTEWILHLHFSESWRGSLKAMRTATHKYVCEYILAQWYRASMPNGSERYEYESDKWLKRLYEEARSEVYRPKPWNL